MKWQTKAKIHSALDQMPLGHQLYYLLQTKVTKSLPRKDNEKYFETLNWHLANIKKQRSDLSKVTLFEFGAGWDLFYNIGLYCAGIDHQILVDLNRHAKINLINHELDRFANGDRKELVREAVARISSLKDLSRIGIDYRAPCDARNTGLDNGSISAIVSTNTMEHIPLADLADIMSEGHRILAQGGIVSARIDYGDHYSYSDRSIGPWNYMKFSQQQWQPFNPDSHYQNRARHSQYLLLFQKAGFEIISHTPLFEYPDTPVPKKSELDQAFHGFSNEDLRATAGLFVLLKP